MLCCTHMRLRLRSSSVLPRQLAAATASRWIQMETPHAPSTTWSRSSPNLTRPDRPTTTVVSDTHHFLFYSDTPRLDLWLLGHRPTGRGSSEQVTAWASVFFRGFPLLALLSKNSKLKLSWWFYFYSINMIVIITWNSIWRSIIQKQFAAFRCL